MVARCYCRYCLLLMMQRCLLRATRVRPLEPIPILILSYPVSSCPIQSSPLRSLHCRCCRCCADAADTDAAAAAAAAADADAVVTSRSEMRSAIAVKEFDVQCVQIRPHIKYCTAPHSALPDSITTHLSPLVSRLSPWKRRGRATSGHPRKKPGKK
jgi:hypothetical protein